MISEIICAFTNKSTMFLPPTIEVSNLGHLLLMNGMENPISPWQLHFVISTVSAVRILREPRLIQDAVLSSYKKSTSPPCVCNEPMAIYATSCVNHSLF